MSNKSKRMTEIPSTASVDGKEPILSPTSELPTAPTLVASPSSPAGAAIVPPPIDSRFDGLRLRMKVWIDPTTRKRYLAPTAMLTDVRRGIFTAYAMSDDDTKQIHLSVDAWNALPFFYFKEDGPAPRGGTRPPDVVDVKK